ncbi:MAG: SagB/ThcOx family dehydrogenase [Streptosporangiaceae bacterium]
MTAPRFRTPADIVISFPGGDLIAERATAGAPVKISYGAVAVLAVCQDGATASDVAAALTAVGYDMTSQDAAGALDILAGAGLVCRDDGDGGFPAAATAARITDDASWGGRWGPAAWLFHYGTRDCEPVDDADVAALRAADLTVPVFKRYPRARQVSLPAPAALPDTAFGDVLAGRRTVREFTPEPVTVQGLSQLLHYTHAPHHLVQADSFGLLPRRSYANGGARSELELYAAIRGTAGLPDGLYHYQSAEHRLELLGPALSRERLLHLSYQQPWCAAAPVTVFVTATPGRSSRKYPVARALRVIYHDAGCLAQVFEMTAAALGLGAYITAFFRDTDTEQALGIDGVQETMTLILGAGIPDPDPEPETIVPAGPAAMLPATLFEDATSPPAS